MLLCLLKCVLGRERATAATAMNEVSSRSHAIFTIHITVTVTTKLSSGGNEAVQERGSALDGEINDDVRYVGMHASRLAGPRSW